MSTIGRSVQDWWLPTGSLWWLNCQQLAMAWYLKLMQWRSMNGQINVSMLLWQGEWAYIYLYVLYLSHFKANLILVGFFIFILFCAVDLCLILRSLCPLHFLLRTPAFPPSFPSSSSSSQSTSPVRQRQPFFFSKWQMRKPSSPVRKNRKTTTKMIQGGGGSSTPGASKSVIKQL